MWGLLPWGGMALAAALAWGAWERGEGIAEQRDAAEARAREATAVAAENARAAAQLAGAGELAGQISRRIEQMGRLDSGKLDKLILEVRSAKDAKDRLPDSWRIALQQLLGSETGAAAGAGAGPAPAGEPARAGGAATPARP